ncbi:MAG: ATP-dependent Clp protease proteolytic subunit [Planctomycetaceae bacterium]
MPEDRPSFPLRAYPGPISAGRSETPKGDWEIMLSGDLTDKQAELADKLMEVPRRSRGTLFIDSSGGSVFSGLALASIIRLRGLDPVAVVAGECSSAALVPFAACRRRYVTPYSALLFHPMRWQSEEDVRLEEAAEWARYFKVLEEDIDGLLTRMFGCEMSLIQKWTRPGKFVKGPELVEAGLAQLVDLFDGDLWAQISRKENRS